MTPVEKLVSAAIIAASVALALVWLFPAPGG